MIRSARMQCPAKVNLFLEVTGKRKDGYHTLATLFAKISLFDVLEVHALEPGPVSLELDGAPAGVPRGPENLVVRAAEAFREAFGVECGVRLVLRKNIPVGAGLGGGSSDAAGALLGMARVFGQEEGGRLKPSARPILRNIAAKLGADVPFFLVSAPLALGKGIGDRLSPLPPPRRALPWLVLVYPGVGIPTAGVYKSLVRPGRSVVLTRLAQLGKLQKKIGGGRPVSEWEGLLFNRLEDAVLPAHPEVGQAKRILSQLGASGVLMSGSGAHVRFVRRGS